MIPGIVAGVRHLAYAGAPYRVGTHVEWGSNTPATLNIDYPSVPGGIRSDDVALIFVSVGPASGTDAAHTCASADGTVETYASSFGARQTVFWKRLSGGESGTIAVGVQADASTNSTWYASMVIYRGCKKTGDPYEGSSWFWKGAASGISTIGAPIRLLGGPDRTAVNFYFISDDLDLTQGSGWTLVSSPDQTSSGIPHRRLISERTFAAPRYAGELCSIASMLTGTNRRWGCIYLRLIPEATVSTGVTEFDDTHMASVTLLAGFDGLDGQGHLFEERNAATSSTLGTTAESDTAQSKFGGGSLRVSSGSVTYPDSSNWHFGSGNFTIEAWVRFSAVGTGTERYLMAQYDTGGNQRSWALRITSTNNLDILVSSAGTSGTSKANAAWAPSTGIWYHVAADFDGTNYRTYINGVMNAKSGTPVALFDSSAPLSIGGAQNSGAHLGAFNGWIDEPRITKGVARYASDAGYTVPTAAFPRY